MKQLNKISLEVYQMKYNVLPKSTMQEVVRNIMYLQNYNCKQREVEQYSSM